MLYRIFDGNHLQHLWPMVYPQLQQEACLPLRMVLPSHRRRCSPHPLLFQLNSSCILSMNHSILEKNICIKSLKKRLEKKWIAVNWHDFECPDSCPQRTKVDMVHQFWYFCDMHSDDEEVEDEELEKEDLKKQPANLSMLEPIEANHELAATKNLVITVEEKKTEAVLKEEKEARYVRKIAQLIERETLGVLPTSLTTLHCGFHYNHAFE